MAVGMLACTHSVQRREQSSSPLKPAYGQRFEMRILYLYTLDPGVGYQKDGSYWSINDAEGDAADTSQTESIDGARFYSRALSQHVTRENALLRKDEYIFSPL